MCGGSTEDKLEAAFILFDADYSSQLSFEELIDMIGSVFNTFKSVSFVKNQEGASFFDQVDMDLLASNTAAKCFKDLKLPTSSEINLKQFSQWLAGTNIYSADELLDLEATKPLARSRTAKNQFKSKTEWAKRFLQDESFLPNLMSIR